MRIAIDIDSTLHHYWDVLSEISRRRFGIELPYEEQFTWGITRLRPDQLELCIEESHSDETILAGRPYPGAVETVRAWSEQGHFIHITSHRSQCMRAGHRSLVGATRAAVRRSVLLLRQGPRCVELDIDMLIDDSPLNIGAAIERGIATATIVHPWNAELCEVEDVLGAEDWYELARLLAPVLPRPSSTILAPTDDPWPGQRASPTGGFTGGRARGGHGELCVVMSIAMAETAPSLSGPWMRRWPCSTRTCAVQTPLHAPDGHMPIDTLQFACWADARRAPSAVVPATYAAIWPMLSERELSATTTARKLAAIRALFRSLREHGQIEQSPADLLATPRRGSHLPRVLKAPEVARLLDSIPAGRAAGHTRSRAVRAHLRVRLARRGDRLLECRRRRSRSRAAAGRGQGFQDPLRARSERSRWAPCVTTWSALVRRSHRASATAARSAVRARARAAERRRGAGAVPQPLREATWHQRRASTVAQHGRLASGWPVGSPHIPCVTASRPIFWTVARTCARSRSCSATRASRQPRSTLG